jgi:hypothetical protein
LPRERLGKDSGVVRQDRTTAAWHTELARRWSVGGVISRRRDASVVEVLVGRRDLGEGVLHRVYGYHHG